MNYSNFKFNPDDYKELIKTWMLVFDHWINPFGNYHEPLPFPDKRLKQGKEKGYNTPLKLWLYWHIRNLLHNFTHFVIGIVPVGKRYEWIDPEYNGWKRVRGNHISWWKKKNRLSLPSLNGNIGIFEYQIGWKSDGNFGIVFRRR